MRAWGLAALVVASAGAGWSLAPPALAQSRRPRPAGTHGVPVPAISSANASAGLRAHFGVDAATRLLRSSNPAERLRGLERAASLHTPEALALLERAASPTTPGGFDPRAPTEGVARKDPRALLVVVRGLAGWTDLESAREALAEES